MPRKKHNFSGKDWWKQGIKFNKSESTSDAEKNFVICMSTNFYSAVMFPTRSGKDEIYVYAIHKPNASLNRFGSLSDIGSQVFDLHSLQLAEAHANLNRNMNSNSGYFGWSLSAYEAFTPFVSSKDIICAIKCKRSDILPEVAMHFIYHHGNKFSHIFDRKFKVGHQIHMNLYCTQLNSPEANMCIKYYKQLANCEYRTTPTAHGLGGTTLPNPKAERLFFFYLRMRYYRKAFRTVLKSLSTSILKLIDNLRSLPDHNILFQSKGDFMKYWIRVTRNQNGAVIALYSPDLGVDLLKQLKESDELMISSILDRDRQSGSELDSPLTIDSASDFRAFTQEQLLSRVTSQYNPFLSPRKLSQLRNIDLTTLEHWECFEIDINSGRRCCEKFLPGLGQGLNVVYYLSNGFLTYMSLRISNGNQDSSQVALPLSVVGTVISSTVVFLIYIASGTSGALAKIGESIDKINLLQSRNIVRFIKNNPKFFAVSGMALSCNLAAIIISCIRLFVENSLLSERFVGLDTSLSENQKRLYCNLIEYLVIDPFIVSGTYTIAAFQSYFLMKLVKSRSKELTIDRTIGAGSITTAPSLVLGTNPLENESLRAEDDSPSPATSSARLVPKNTPLSTGSKAGVHFEYKNLPSRTRTHERTQDDTTVDPQNRISICSHCVII